MDWIGSGLSKRKDVKKEEKKTYNLVRAIQVLEFLGHNLGAIRAAIINDDHLEIHVTLTTVKEEEENGKNQLRTGDLPLVSPWSPLRSQ